MIFFAAELKSCEFGIVSSGLLDLELGCAYSLSPEMMRRWTILLIWSKGQSRYGALILESRASWLVVHLSFVLFSSNTGLTSSNRYL